MRPGISPKRGAREGGAMLIDCDECVMQHTTACEDCLVTMVIGVTSHPATVEFDEEEQAAVEHLADVGLIPQLRLVPRNHRRSSSDRATG